MRQMTKDDVIKIQRLLINDLCKKVREMMRKENDEKELYQIMKLEERFEELKQEYPLTQIEKMRA